MANIKLKGNPINTCGELPKIGSNAPSFKLVATDLSEKTLSDYSGKNVILSIVPSVDTGVCAASVRRFNEAAEQLDNTVVINVSMDLPFATKRLCESEGLTNIENLSAFRSPEFGNDYGIRIVDGPLKGLMGRAIVVIDPRGKVCYTEQVPEITQEPNYESALEAVGQTV